MTTAAALTDTAFGQVAQHGLSQVGIKVVREAALAVWHGVDSINLQTLSGPCLGEALCLLERLSFYNLVPQDRKRSLLGQVRQSRAGLLETVDVQAFEATYRKYLPDLQPLQTRHAALLEVTQPA